MYATMLLLHVLPKPQNVQKWKEAAVQRNGPRQADQATTRCSVYE